MSPCPGRRDSRPSPFGSIDSIESIERTELELGGPRAGRHRQECLCYSAGVMHVVEGGTLLPPRR